MTGADELGLGPLSPKAAELLAAGPGHFSAKRETTLEFVRAQREALAALPRPERDDIDRLLLGLSSALTGLEQPRAPVDTLGDDPSTLGRILRKLRGLSIASMATAAARQQGEWDDMTTAAGGVFLPPPNEVIEVARSFLVTEKSPDLDPAVRERLRRGWLAVSIEPR